MSSQAQLVARLEAGPQHDERLHDLAGDRVGLADHAGLGDRRVLHQRALDLERADQVAGRLDDVVAPPDEPEVAVGVAAGEVAGEVPAAGEALAVALLLVEVAAEHRRPARPQRELALLAGVVDLLDASPSRTTTSPCSSRRRIAASMPGQRPAHRARAGCRIAAKLAIMIPPVSVCHQLSWIGQAERLDAPAHGLRVERLADAGDEPQRARGRARARRSAPALHQHAHRRRRGVPDASPARSSRIRYQRSASNSRLVDDARHAVRERRDDPVRRAGHPAGIGGAPEDVVGVEVERAARRWRGARRRPRGRAPRPSACPSCRS